MRIIPIILICLLAPLLVCGAELTATPELELCATHEDNLFLSTAEQVDDMITTLAPSLALQAAGDTWRAGGDARAARLIYRDNDRLDTTEALLDLDLSAELSERTRLDMESSLSRKSALDGDLEETGLIYTRTDRDTFLLRPELTWQATERLRLALQAGVQETRFEDPDYFDYTLFETRLRAGHVLPSETLILFVEAGGARADPRRGRVTTVSAAALSYREEAAVETRGMGAGLLWQPRNLWRLSCVAGARRARVSYAPFLAVTLPEPGLVREESYDAVVGSLALERRFERGALSAEMERDLVPATSELALDRLRLRLRARATITELLEGETLLGWSTAESISEHLDTDHETLSFAARLDWHLTERCTSSLSWQSDRYKDHTAHTTRTRNRIMLCLAYGWPITP